MDMFKLKRTLVQNVITNFIPFVVMTLVAVFFLWNSYSLLENKNMSIMNTQMQNVLDKVEMEIASAMELADTVLSDSSLSMKGLEGDGRETVSGLTRLRSYESRLPFHASIYLNYEPERIISGDGVVQLKNYLNAQLKLDQEGKEKFLSLFASAKEFQSSVLSKQDGGSYLLLQYYLPKGPHMDEERMGILLDVQYILDEFIQHFQNMDALVLLYFNGEELGRINSLTEAIPQEQLAENFRMLEAGETIPGYTMMTCQADYMDLGLKIGINHNELRQELVAEEIKMAMVGIVLFILLSIFLWATTHYRYTMMRQIRQFIRDNHSSIDEKGNEYHLIQRVLEKDLETINRKNEDFNAFRREAQKQLTWLLLNSAIPEDLSAEDLMTDYNMEWDGAYLCVIDFVTDDSGLPCWDETQNEKFDIILSCETKHKNAAVLIACVNLKSRDPDYKERRRLIRRICDELSSRGVQCQKITCGMVYDSLSDIHSSQQEALTLIHNSEEHKTGDEILFFSEQANMAKKVPHNASDLLQLFRQYVQEKDRQEALCVFDTLIALSEDAKEDLAVYIRYKIISILMETADENEAETDRLHSIVKMNKLEGLSFLAETREILEIILDDSREKRLELDQLLAYIEEQFSNPEISLQMVSLHFEVSERTVRRVMKKGLNKTYKEYLSEVRLKHACELLENTDHTIQEISSRVGFYSANPLYRTFKQAMGMTPDEYRTFRKQKEE